MSIRANTAAAPGGLIAEGALAWLAVAAAIGIASAQAGVSGGASALGALIGAAPALATLAAATHLARPGALAICLFAWTAFAMIATALTGGAMSPAALCFAIAPALAHGVGERRATFEAVGFALGAYAFAAVAGAGLEAAPNVGAAPVAAGLAALALSAFWALTSTAPAPVKSSAVRGERDLEAPASLSLDAEGRVRAAGSIALARLGAAAGDKGMALHELVARAAGPRAGDDVRIAVARARAGGEGRAEVPIDGRTFALEVHPTRGGAIAALVDVGDLAERLSALESDAAAAREARTARSRQTAELSHELRTPLSHILGFAEIMQRELYGPLAPKYQEYVALIQTSGRNLLDLITGLMDLSRLDGGRYALDPERFDARDIVAEVGRLSADAAARRTVALHVEMPDEAIEVDADPRALRQMILNLTTNALKFTPSGGAVTILARVEDDAFIVDVVDTGPGIAPDERVRLGRAFERGAAATGVEGVGLGLALTRAFAELHGGDLSFHDAPGRGALVRISLPVLARPRPGM